MPGRIFVNYRRSDSLKDAFLIAARLKDRYGARNVFLDENLSGGQIFPQVLEKRLAQCSVMLTVIGPDWLGATGDDGTLRLAHKDDWVRHEIRRALERGIPLVPVLLNGAALPARAALPQDIARLVDHHAVPVRTADHGFRGDMSVLIEAVDRIRGRVSWPAVGAGAAALLLGGWGLAYQQGIPVWVPWQATPTVTRADPSAEAARQAAVTAKADADRLAEAEAKLLAAQAAQKKAEATARQFADAADKSRRDQEAREKAAREEAAKRQAADDARVKAAAEAERMRVAAEQRQKEAAEQRQKEVAQKKAEEAARRDPLLALSPGSKQAARDRLANGQPCAFCPEMVVAPAGSFTMGSPASEPERESWQKGTESPQTRVSIARPFAVGRFAVTFDEWDACVADGGCNGHKPGDQGWGRGKRPVINVNWDDAKAYAAWLSRKTGKSYRLLSETEREYVTRAGTTTPFWWGSSITPAQVNYNGSADPYKGGGSKGEYRQRTMPVDSFEANPWGLYNVHGNVWEWTEDCWNASNQGNPGNGSARTSGECTLRVLRGGGWGNLPLGLRSALRYWSSTEDRFNSLGLRVARTINP